MNLYNHVYYDIMKSLYEDNYGKINIIGGDAKMKTGYAECIKKEIALYTKGDIVRTDDLAGMVVREFGVLLPHAKSIVNVAMKRIADKHEIPGIRRYGKGVYYHAKTTPFGETNIDIGKLLQEKYLKNDIGYETGPALLNQVGLTTLMPTVRQIATNRTNTARMDKKLHIMVRPARTLIHKQNKRYLQFLDILEMMGETPIDAANPEIILKRFMNEHGLTYVKMLAYAKRYYSTKVILKIADLAEMDVA